MKWLLYGFNITDRLKAACVLFIHTLAIAMALQMEKPLPMRGVLILLYNMLPVVII